MNSSQILSVFTIILATTMSGCGGGGAPDQPDLAPLTGTITVDGSPVEGLEVSFQPESGRPSIANTDAAGKFEMQYTANESGVKLGKGVIRITDGISASESYGSEGESAEDSGEGSGYGDEKETIPVKYNVEAADNPEMNIEVGADGKEFTLDIKSK